MINVNSGHGKISTHFALKYWSKILAITGLCFEITLLFLRFFVLPRTLTLLHVLLPSGSIALGLLLLVVWNRSEQAVREKKNADDETSALQQKTEVQTLPSQSTLIGEQEEPGVQIPPFQSIQTSGEAGLTIIPPLQQRTFIFDPPLPYPVHLATILNKQLPLLSIGYPVQSPLIVPLEGGNLEECDDYATSNDKHNRYAVTDGVAQSFMAARWAKLVAQHFVERRDDFSTEEDCAKWLRNCSQEWELWVRNEKLPALEKEYNWIRWDLKFEGGAQTTLIGCSLFATKEHAISVRVTSLGDAYFFLCRQHMLSSSHELWIEMYPAENPDGGNLPHTFKTLAGIMPEHAFARIQRSVQALNCARYTAHIGDVILLVTDKLALWIWQCIVNGDNRLLDLLKQSDAQAFRTFIEEERQSRRLVRDDTTLYMIPLTEELYRQLSIEQEGSNQGCFFAPREVASLLPPPPVQGF